MQADLILDAVTPENHVHWLAETERPVIDRSARVQFDAPDTTGRMYLTELEAAFLPGKTCPRYAVSRFTRTQNTTDLISHFGSLTGLMEEIRELRWSPRTYGTHEGRGYEACVLEANGIAYRVERDDRDAQHVYSPLHLFRLRPLDRAPSRWTLSHVRRALANGQYRPESLQRLYLQKKSPPSEENRKPPSREDPLTLVRSLTENPHAWSCHTENHRIVFSSSHDTLEFIFHLPVREPG